MLTIQDLLEFILNSPAIHGRCLVTMVMGISGYQWKVELFTNDRQLVINELAKRLESTNETFFVKGFYIWDMNLGQVIFGEQVYPASNQIVNNDPKAQGKIANAGGYGDYRRYTNKRD
jgi:hypothetical protein